MIGWPASVLGSRIFCLAYNLRARRRVPRQRLRKGALFASLIRSLMVRLDAVNSVPFFVGADSSLYSIYSWLAISSYQRIPSIGKDAFFVLRAD